MTKPNDGILPPTVASNDGREIWAWAGRLSKLAIENHELRTLAKQNSELKSRCGSCDFWMLSSCCPREIHSNKTGCSVGPHANAATCKDFQMKSYVSEIIAKNEAKIAEIFAAREVKP